MSESSEAMDAAAKSSEITTSTNMSDSTFPETVKMQNTTLKHFIEKSEKDLLIAELKEKLSAALAKNEELNDLVSKLREKVVDLEEKYKILEEQLFTFKNIASNDSLIAFYTGFPNFQTTMALYNYLDPGDRGENINYWFSGKDVDGTARPVKQGRPRTSKPVDEFFLTLCRPRQGFAELHLAHLSNVSQPTVSRIFTSWITFSHLKLGNINIWPSRELVNETMPEDFKAKYPTTRVIID